MTKTYHFTGIKGSGMSALALMLHQMGHKVQGSDSADYYFTQRELDEAGVPILPFSSANLNPNLEIIVGNAFKETTDEHGQDTTNPELRYLLDQGLPFKRYHEMLGEFMRQFISFGVAGAHGKTSTTGILAHVMKDMTDTSYLIGDGTGHGSSQSQYFVFESDEYERHFAPYYPQYSIITNVDFDHPDFFTSVDEVFEAFNDYAKQVEKGLFVYGEDPYLRKITAQAPIYTYGFEDNNDFQAVDVNGTTKGSDFRVLHGDKDLGLFYLPAYGLHNVLNGLAVVANLYIAGFDMDQVRKHLATFPGVKRRFTEKIVKDTIMVDDFAHHPTEITATLEAARQKYPGKDIVAIFQPHTYSRTKALLAEFAASLNDADHVYLAEIYGSAREKDDGQVKSADLAARIQKSAVVIDRNDVSTLLNHENAVYVFMGAGDIQSYEHVFEELILSQVAED